MNLEVVATADLIRELATRTRITGNEKIIPLYRHAVEAVASALNLPPAEIISINRAAHLTYARYLAYSLLQSNGLSTPTIGALFNRRASSILHGLTRHAQRLLTDTTWHKKTQKAQLHFKLS